MKKIILGLITTIMMLAVSTTMVNAASLKVSTGEVKKGNQVTVTLQLNQASRNIDLTLKYDASKFEYVKKSATAAFPLTENANNDGEVIITGSDATTSTETVTFTFIAKETTNSASFTGSDIVTQSGEEFAEGQDIISVKVVEGTTTPTENENNNNNNSDNSENNNNNTDQDEDNSDNEELLDSSGKPIKSIPQAGTRIAVFALIAIVIAGISVIMVKKSK